MGARIGSLFVAILGAFLLVAPPQAAAVYYAVPQAITFNRPGGEFFAGGGTGQYQIRTRTPGSSTGSSTGTALGGVSTNTGPIVYNSGTWGAPTEIIFGVAPGTGSAWSSFIPLESVFTNTGDGDNTTPTPLLKFTQNVEALSVADLVAAPDLNRDDLRETSGPDGEDVDNLGVPISVPGGLEPDYYESNVLLENTTSAPITYNIAVDGLTDSNNTLTLQPGESTNLTIRQDGPFDYQITSPGSAGMGSIENGGYDYGGPPQVVASGSGGAQSSGTAPGGVVPQPTPTTQTGNVVTAPPTAPAAAGTAPITGNSSAQTNQNANDNHANTNAKIDRLGTIMLNGQDTAHKDANNLGGKLDKLLEGTGVKTGDGEGAEEIEVGSGEGLQGLHAKFAMLITDVEELAEKIAQPDGSTASLNMSIACPAPIGTFTLDIDQHASSIAICRTLLLTFAVTCCVFWCISTVRGAMVDEA